jgi:hypothetical protein
MLVYTTGTVHPMISLSTSTSPTGPWSFPQSVGKEGTAASVAYGGGKYVVVGDATSNNVSKGFLVYSSDGVNWTDLSSSLPGSGYGVSYGAGVPNPMDIVSKVVYAGGTFFAFSDYGGDGLYTSTNGTTWTYSDHPFDPTPIGGIVNIAYSNGMWAALTADLQVRKSTNLSSPWTVAGTANCTDCGSGTLIGF